jgi:hypothetical protein
MPERATSHAKLCGPTRAVDLSVKLYWLQPSVTELPRCSLSSCNTTRIVFARVAPVQPCLASTMEPCLFSRRRGVFHSGKTGSGHEFYHTFIRSRSPQTGKTDLQRYSPERALQAYRSCLYNDQPMGSDIGKGRL